MFVPSRIFAHRVSALPILLLATPALAQVTITCDQAEVTSRVPCTLTATHGDGKPRTWKWSVVGLDDASQLLEAIAPDKVRVRTPVTLVERSFTVVAVDGQDPSVTGTFVLRITPNPKSGSGERALAEGLFPSAFTPSLVPFRDHPERLREDEFYPGSEFPDPVLGIAFCDDAAMGALDRCWILAKGRRGLGAFKVAGDPVPLPAGPGHKGRSCKAVATLPPGSGEVPAGAPRVVFCEELERHGEALGHWIYALEADGRRRLLAGGYGRFHQDGPGKDARFASVSSLALDRKGNVYVCEILHGIRRIGLDGQVSTLRPAGYDHTDGAFTRPIACTLDPATGDLYARGMLGLEKLTPEGQVSMVIGGQGRALARSHGEALARLAPGRVPRNTRFDFWPRDMAIHGRELFLVDEDGIDVFHLDSRRLARVVPCDPKLEANRLGPVPYLNPHLPASRCAAVQSVSHLALTKEAMGLVAMGSGLAELELPDAPVTSVMDPPNPTGAGELKESKALATELDNLWPGQAQETGTVRTDGTWGATHWRSAEPGRRFSGRCSVESRGLSQGWAQICLLFADKDGKGLGHSEPAGPRMPDVVSAPVPGRTLIRMTGTVPQGADRVALCLRVVKGNPGAEVSFHDVTFLQLP